MQDKMKTCNRCQYFRDFTSLNGANLGLRCMNPLNSPIQGDYLIVSSPNYFCDYFKYAEDFDPIEFDPRKDKKNIENRGLSLGLAREILCDPKKIQMVEMPDKWEKFDLEEFEEKGIPQNTGNCDPIRGKYFGHLSDGKLYVFIYTFRHEIGDMKLRIISLRRASEDERKQYHDLLNHLA
jgi:uncharacterized DUF497 family protein